MKRLKTIIFLVLAFSIFAIPSEAQQRELEEGQVKGYVTTSKGKKIEGIIQLSSLINPWENQRKIKLISEKDFYGKKKLKRKDWKKYNQKDLDGYGYDGRVFLTKKYTPTGSASAADANKFTGITSMASNLSKNKHFMEEVENGKMKVYAFHNYPPDVAAYSGDEYKNVLNDLRYNPELLVETGKGKKKGKLKPVQNVKWKKILADCPEVLEKFENDEYAIKSKGIKGFLTKNSEGSRTENGALVIIKEYNACMEKGK